MTLDPDLRALSDVLTTLIAQLTVKVERLEETNDLIGRGFETVGERELQLLAAIEALAGRIQVLYDRVDRLDRLAPPPPEG